MVHHGAGGVIIMIIDCSSFLGWVFDQRQGGRACCFWMV